MTIVSMPSPARVPMPQPGTLPRVAPRPWSLDNHPAFAREPESTWALVACHFNPARYRRPVENLGAFLDWVHGNRLPLYMAELTFCGTKPVLPTMSPHVVQFALGPDGIMFQKEALLSAVVPRLPAHVDKIFFVDADVVYDDPGSFWSCAAFMEESGARLVQPFSHAVWNGPDGIPGGIKKGIGWEALAGPENPRLLDPTAFHPGFAFGLWRSFFKEVGPLVGCPITGTGDIALWQAALMSRDPVAPPGRLGYQAPAPEPWRQSVARHVDSRIFAAHGMARHFYHGGHKARAYAERHELLRLFSWSGSLQRDRSTGLPVWAPGARALQAAMSTYFAQRDEDL